MKNQEVSS